MKRYAEKIINMVKSENLFAPQGGPIILAQVCYTELRNWSRSRSLSFIYFCFETCSRIACTDRKRVQRCPAFLQRKWKEIRRLGCRYGYQFIQWSPLGYVQTEGSSSVNSKCTILNHDKKNHRNYVTYIFGVSLFSRSLLAMGDIAEKHSLALARTSLPFGLRIGLLSTFIYIYIY